MFNKNTESFGICKLHNWYENSRQVYGIRGTGPTYKNFYQRWLYNNKRIIWNETNFPWDYVTLTEEAEKELYENYNEYIYEDIIE